MKKAIRNNIKPYMLDTVAENPAIALSLRKIVSGYNGPCIKVRRSTDNLELDIGFDAWRLLNTSELLRWCGAGDGFISVWYDESGLARNAVQVTFLYQPKIVASGKYLGFVQCNTAYFNVFGDNVFGFGDSSFSIYTKIAVPNNSKTHWFYGGRLYGTGYQYIVATIDGSYYSNPPGYHSSAYYTQNAVSGEDETSITSDNEVMSDSAIHKIVNIRRAGNPNDEHLMYVDGQLQQLTNSNNSEIVYAHRNFGNFEAAYLLGATSNIGASDSQIYSHIIFKKELNCASIAKL